MFQCLPREAGVVQRLRYRLGHRRGESALILDRLLFRRTYPELARIVRVLCTAAARWRWPLVAAVAVNCPRVVRQRADPNLAGDGPRPVRAGSGLALVF